MQPTLNLIKHFKLRGTYQSTTTVPLEMGAQLVYFILRALLGEILLPRILIVNKITYSMKERFITRF